MEAYIPVGQNGTSRSMVLCYSSGKTYNYCPKQNFFFLKEMR
jgi:hypothetical protein